MISGPGARECSLETVTGEIRLDLAWDAAFRATITTRGEIASDYSTDLVWLPDSRMKKSRVVAGEDGPAIELRSDRGNVRLLRQNQSPQQEENDNED